MPQSSPPALEKGTPVIALSSIYATTPQVGGSVVIPMGALGEVVNVGQVEGGVWVLFRGRTEAVYCFTTQVEAR